MKYLSILLASFISLYGIYPFTVQAEAIPRIPRQAATDGDYYGLPLITVSTEKDFAAEIKKALSGDLKVANTTKVTSKDPPAFTNYIIEFSLPCQEKTSKRTQPLHIGILTLVSDDGCTANVHTNPWLKEKGKGHDISAGQRDYPHIRSAQNNPHRVHIEYSQVYYDPKPNQPDLDGLSLILRLIPVDVSVRKKDDPASMNDRILIKKGDSVEFILHPSFINDDTAPQIEDKVKWEFNKLNASNNLEEKWQSCTGATGTRTSYTFDETGIYQIRANIEGKTFMYEMRKDASGNYGNIHLLEGKPDYIGVASHELQIALVKEAFAQLVSTTYAKAAALSPPLGYGMFPDELTYKGASKCNIFVFMQANKVGAKIPVYKFGYFFDAYWAAPTVDKWKDSTIPLEYKEKDDKITMFWQWQNLAKATPEPGCVVTNDQHCGILDYDGSWINAGPDAINKKVHLIIEDKEDGMQPYKLHSIRKLIVPPTTKTQIP